MQEKADDFVFLSEALDALDRLYDGAAGAIEVRAILRVTGTALSDRLLGAQMLFAAEGLSEAMRLARPDELSKEAALIVTDVVRIRISEAWGETDSGHGGSA